MSGIRGAKCCSGDSGKLTESEFIQNVGGTIPLITYIFLCVCFFDDTRDQGRFNTVGFSHGFYCVQKLVLLQSWEFHDKVLTGASFFMECGLKLTDLHSMGQCSRVPSAVSSCILGFKP